MWVSSDPLSRTAGLGGAPAGAAAGAHVASGLTWTQKRAASAPKVPPSGLKLGYMVLVSVCTDMKRGDPKQLQSPQPAMGAWASGRAGVRRRHRCALRSPPRGRGAVRALRPFGVKPGNCRCPARPLAPDTLSGSKCQCIS